MENWNVVEAVFLTRGRCEISSAGGEHGLPRDKNGPHRRGSSPGSSRNMESAVKLRWSESVLSSIHC